MSILASCERLPATIPDLANRPRQLVFLTPIDSQLNDFLNEIHQIALLEPSIVERIDEDLDLHAKKKKLLRLADAEFLAGQTLDLPKLQLQLRELQIDKIQLEIGRPRTDAYIVYLFLMLRGFNGGCKDQHARLLLEESITVKLWLEHLGQHRGGSQHRAAHGLDHPGPIDRSGLHHWQQPAPTGLVKQSMAALT